MLRQIIIFFLLSTISCLSVRAEFADMKNTSISNWKSQLRSGQIVTVESSDPLLLPTMLGAENFSPFVHLGVIEVTHSGTYVYDASADIGKSFLEERPISDMMQGSVRRVELDKFLKRYRVLNFFTPPATVDVARFMAFIKQHWKDKTPFDPYFDLDEKSALYCSEFIALGLENAGGKKIIPATMRANASLEVIRRWMKISKPKFFFPYQLVEPKNWMGTVSLDHSKPTLIAERLVKYELYQRFTNNQKIGNVVRQSGINLVFRKPIEEFVTNIRQLSLQPSYVTANLSNLSKAVQNIANKRLGPTNNVRTEFLPRCQLDMRLCVGQ